jgi:hypothetical protein
VRLIEEGFLNEASVVELAYVHTLPFAASTIEQSDSLWGNLVLAIQPHLRGRLRPFGGGVSL